LACFLQHSAGYLSEEKDRGLEAIGGRRRWSPRYGGQEGGPGGAQPCVLYRGVAAKGVRAPADQRPVFLVLLQSHETLTFLRDS